jgi:transposase
MKHHVRSVYGGVDTHRDIHVAAVIDPVGTLLGTKSFPTTPLGPKSLERLMSKHGTVAQVGVEGTGTYGLGLQRVLQAAHTSTRPRCTWPVAPPRASPRRRSCAA